MKLPKLKKAKRQLRPVSVDHFFDNSLFDTSFLPDFTLKNPAINISENKKDYEIEIALPGFDKKDVKIEIEDNVLVISSEKEIENKKSKKNWLKHEYSYSSFERRIPLPEGADENKITAKMKNGILTVKTGKKEGFETVQKKIEVK